MRLSLASRGGQAAAIHLRLPARELDTDTLPPETSRHLRSLVAAAGTESRTAPRSGPARDEMSYTITVDDDGRSTTLTASDTTMSPAFGELLGLIERHTAT